MVASTALGCAPPPVIPGSDDTGAQASGDGDSTAGAAMDGAALDPLMLDRSESAGPCGYPGPGDAGYGTDVGQRLADSGSFELIDCEGNPFSLADFMCEREGGGYNAGVLLNLGAGWCGPCQEETLEFPEVYEEYHSRGIEIVQVMFQDWDAQAPTRSFCSDWSEGQWRTGADGSVQDVGVRLHFPVLLDQINDWTSIYLQDPQSATPVNILIDANGNIRWKLEGQQPELDLLRAQFDLVLADPYGN